MHEKGGDFCPGNKANALDVDNLHTLVKRKRRWRYLTQRLEKGRIEDKGDDGGLGTKPKRVVFRGGSRWSE